MKTFNSYQELAAGQSMTNAQCMTTARTLNAIPRNLQQELAGCLRNSPEKPFNRDATYEILKKISTCENITPEEKQEIDKVMSWIEPGAYNVSGMFSKEVVWDLMKKLNVVPPEWKEHV